MANTLEGKVALVTGASKGIGAGIALQFAAEGAAVVVNYATDKDGADRVVSTIESRGGRAIAVQADVGKAADVERLFTESDKAFGGQLDVLVNNAGVFYFTPIDTVTPDVFHKAFDVNVLGTVLCTQAAARRFSANGGSVISISSVVASKGFPQSVVYSASKGALDSITRVFATELAPRKIRVNSINPGLVVTEGTSAAGMTTGEFEKVWLSLAAMGRAGTPEDIAPIALFLASPASGWLTGETIFATGGVR